MKREPTVSVIIPTYNRREYVQEAIDSVLAQTYKDYEIIVVDDGSTDGTGEALKARYGDGIRYVWQENQGESVARNRGTDMARGEYVGFLDSDDLYLPHKLEKQVPILEESPDVGMVFAGAWIIDEEGDRVGDKTLDNGTDAESFDTTDLYFSNFIGGPSTTLIRKGVFDRTGVFDPEIRFAEEWDLWLRIVSESRVVGLDEMLACIRRHRGGQSHYPHPDHNARRLADWVKRLEKAFDRDDVPEALRRVVLARQYAHGFIWEVAVGNHESAERNLRQAGELDPSFVGDPEGLGQLITNHVSRVADDGESPDFGRARDALRSIFASWRGVNGPDSGFERRVSGKVYAALSFVALRASLLEEASRYAWLAILSDPRWIKNRGLVKNLLSGLSRAGGRLGVAILER
ncbi:MAG: glycosyltransferase [Chloroflexota bacterium]|nr:glycosyltransferase [Chloroflexota bacterium]